ncbi:MAG: hypothetical protein K0R89_2421 [Ramlibacter sp.]|nr:hypothetical protein [Ramlibacter sp.]
MERCGRPRRIGPRPAPRGPASTRSRCASSNGRNVRGQRLDVRIIEAGQEWIGCRTASVRPGSAAHLLQSPRGVSCLLPCEPRHAGLRPFQGCAVTGGTLQSIQQRAACVATWRIGCSRRCQRGVVLREVFDLLVAQLRGQRHHDRCGANPLPKGAPLGDEGGLGLAFQQRQGGVDGFTGRVTGHATRRSESRTGRGVGRVGPMSDQHASSQRDGCRCAGAPGREAIRFHDTLQERPTSNSNRWNTWPPICLSLWCRKPKLS